MDLRRVDISSILPVIVL